MSYVGTARPVGELGLRVIRAMPEPKTIKELMDEASPQRGLPDEVNAWRAINSKRVAKHLTKLGTARFVARKFGLAYMWSELRGRVLRADGRELDYGLLGVKLVTNNGVGYIVDAFQNSVELENMKYHGIGTTNTAEAQADSALAAEITTAYNPDSTRATGTTTESAANIYRTVGTNTVDGAVAAVEHGIFSQAATGGGVLLDRTVFTVINLASGDGLETTYDLTFTAGG